MPKPIFFTRQPGILKKEERVTGIDWRKVISRDFQEREESDWDRLAESDIPGFPRKRVTGIDWRRVISRDFQERGERRE